MDNQPLITSENTGGHLILLNGSFGKHKWVQICFRTKNEKRTVQSQMLRCINYVNKSQCGRDYQQQILNLFVSIPK